MKKVIVYIGIGAAVVIIGMLAYEFWSLNRQVDKLRAERDELSTAVLNHQIEASVHTSVDTAVGAAIKTSGDASNRLNAIVNRKLEGR